MFLDVHDVESDLGFHHGPEVIPRTFPMTWATKFDPHHLLDPLLLIPGMLDLVECVFEQINNLDVCFCFFLLTTDQRITDELRETERLDQHHQYEDCHSRVPKAPV